MILTNLFKIKKMCQHEKITPEIESGYCPDCGKLIENEWYITRCNCCGVKLKAIIKNDEIITQHKFCSNCGSSDYKIEKLAKINFIDINYAVLIKKVINQTNTVFTTQCWQEKTNTQPKLLAQYL